MTQWRTFARFLFEFALLSSYRSLMNFSFSFQVDFSVCVRCCGLKCIQITLERLISNHKQHSKINIQNDESESHTMNMDAKRNLY